MIEARELTERYGDTTAVLSLSFMIAPGTVTGLLGPNGARKSTTMRMIVGLDRPTSGTVTSPQAGMLEVSGTTTQGENHELMHSTRAENDEGDNPTPLRRT